MYLEIKAISTGLVVILICLVLSAFFALTEAAVLSISALKAKHIQEVKGKSADILNLWIKHPSLILVALLIGNNLFNIFASVYTEELTRQFLGKSAVLTVSIVMTFIIVLFGEVIPKTFAKNFAVEIIIPVLKIFKYFFYILWPVSRLMAGISTPFNVGFLECKRRTALPLPKKNYNFLLM